MKSLLLHKLILCFILVSCNDSKKDSKDIAISATTKTNAKHKNPKLSEAFKDYWYAGEAEISSYKLEQVRYGEIREGHTVLIYVTEDFLPDVQVKADNHSRLNIPLLKLNATKTFNTGIYPYSIMQSTFYPVINDGYPLKISTSVQEWCGHVYTQLNNKDDFEVKSHSYFQGEADESVKLEKTFTENSIWTQLRIDPKTLPIGPVKIIPSFEFIRLKHKPLKAYQADAELENSKYTLYYPELDRTLSINFNPEFPYNILSWEETIVAGFGSNSKHMTTKATKLKTVKSPYWEKNRNEDAGLRKELGLE
jgi:hypothetical protein